MERDPSTLAPGPTAKTPVVDLITFLGRPHMHQVIFHVAGQRLEPIRFNELLASSGVPRNTLVNRLAELVAEGMLQRTEYDEVPKRVDYAPTAKLLDLVPAFKAMHAWGDRHELGKA